MLITTIDLRMKKSKQNNIRTDIITHQKFNRKELNRVVFNRKDGHLYLDNENKIQGRSIYFSRDEKLINNMIKKSILEKRLKSKNIFDKSSYDEIIESLSNLTKLEGEKYGKTNK